MLGILSGRKLQPITRPFSAMHPITKIGIEVLSLEVAQVQSHVVNLLQQAQQQQQQMAIQAQLAGLQGTTMKFHGPYSARTMGLQSFGGAAFAPAGGGGGVSQGGAGVITAPDMGVTLPVYTGGGLVDAGDELDFIEDEGLGVLDVDLPVEEVSAASLFDDTQVGVGLVSPGPAAGAGIITGIARPTPTGSIYDQPAPTSYAIVQPGYAGPTITLPSGPATRQPLTQTVYDRVSGLVFFALTNAAPFRMRVDVEVSGRFSDFELFRTRIQKELPGRGGIAQYKTGFAVEGAETQDFMRDLKTDYGEDSKIILVVDAVVKWMNNTHRISDARAVGVRGL